MNLEKFAVKSAPSAERKPYMSAKRTGKTAVKPASVKRAAPKKATTFSDAQVTRWIQRGRTYNP